MKNLILFTPFLLLMSACSSPSSPPNGEADAVSPAIAAKAVGHRYVRGQSSISFGKDGTFEISMDAIVRAFPLSGLVKEGEVDARCQFKLEGVVQFKAPKDILVADVQAKSAGFLKFSKTRVLSSAVHRTDLNTVEPQVVCETAAARMLTIDRPTLAVIDLTDDRFEIAGLTFTVIEQLQHAFSIYESLQDTVSGDSRRNNFFNSVFVQEGMTSDQTSRLLPDLAGVYNYDSFPRFTMDLSLLDRQIYLVSEKCSLQTRYSIEGLVFDRNGLYLKTKVLEASKVSKDPDCATISRMVELLAKGETPVSYAISKEMKVITFVQKDLAYSSIYQFKLK